MLHRSQVAEGGDTFPNAARVVAPVDRLVHNAKFVAIDGDSYRSQGGRATPEGAKRCAPQATRRLRPRGTPDCVATQGMPPWDRPLTPAAPPVPAGPGLRSGATGADGTGPVRTGRVRTVGTTVGIGRRPVLMVVSIGAIASPAQGVGYFERDGYYAKDDAAHREASVWLGAGPKALGLSGPVDPDVFRAVLEGEVPDGSGRRLGRLDRDGNCIHRAGRDLTFSAPKSVSLTALVGGDARVVDAHDRAVRRALGWVEKNVAETRVHDRELERLVRSGSQKTVVAGFRHDTSRNLDPQLHTHAVIANKVQGTEGKWRTMSNERLYATKTLMGALYRAELARDLGGLGYRVGKTHADGRFEIAGVSRNVMEAFSTRRQAIEAAMAERGADGTAADPRLAERASVFSRTDKNRSFPFQ